MAISSHERPNEGATNEWHTPLALVRSLGEFSLDPCGAEGWPTATTIYEGEDGLTAPWLGRVWLNPPYGPHVGKWLRRLADHGNGIALIFARTETKTFFEHVWGRADALLFIKGRLRFYKPDGTEAKGNAGAPSVLIAYGERNVEALRDATIDGALVAGWTAVSGPAKQTEEESGER